MSEATVLWLFGIIAACLAGLLGLFIAHIVSDMKRNEAMGKMIATLDRMEKEIGSHDSGLRGSVHRLHEDTRRVLMRLAMRVGEEE